MNCKESQSQMWLGESTNWAFSPLRQAFQALLPKLGETAPLCRASRALLPKQGMLAAGIWYEGKQLEIVAEYLMGMT
jgi:hypothetical protein